MENETMSLETMDVRWTCPACHAANTDNYYLSRTVLCDQCSTWHEWEQVAPSEILDALYWARLWYAEETGDGDTMEAMRGLE